MSQSGRILASAARPSLPADAASVRRSRRGLVLCGGKSSRMGRDKALLELDGATLVERAARVLDEVAPEVWLACGSETRYVTLGRRLILDQETGAGPLSGIAAALGELDDDGWLCVLACDMPRVEAELFDRLLERAHADALDVCLATTSRGWEPMCAVYHARCRTSVRAALARGERRMVGFWKDGEDLRVGSIAVTEEDGVNLNTPAEYEQELAAREKNEP